MSKSKFKSARMMRCACAIMAFAAVSVSAAAQEAMPTQPPAETPAPAPATSGLLNELGKLLKNPADLLPASPKNESVSKPDVASPPPSAPSSADAPPVASARLVPGVVSGREVCPRSPNGAPDCQSGSDKLCRSKGYTSGKSLNTDSAYDCSARQARASGKPCGTEHFVTSALCQ